MKYHSFENRNLKSTAGTRSFSHPPAVSPRSRFDSPSTGKNTPPRSWHTYLFTVARFLSTCFSSFHHSSYLLLLLPFNPLGGAPIDFFYPHVQTIHIHIYTHTHEIRSNEVGTSQQRMRSNVAAAIGSVIKPDSTGKLQSFSGWTPANGSRKNKRDSIPLYRLFDPGCLFALHRSWVLLSHRSSNFDNEAFDEISFLI